MSEKMYLNVPKEEKDQAKELGARWDKEEVKWYTFSDNEHKDKLLERWPLTSQASTQRETQEPSNVQSGERIYLNVPKEDKEIAKALGAKWDNKEISWYTLSDNPKNEELNSLFTKRVEAQPVEAEKLSSAKEALGSILQDKNLQNALAHSLGKGNAEQEQKIKLALEVLDKSLKQSPSQSMKM